MCENAHKNCIDVYPPKCIILHFDFDLNKDSLPNPTFIFHTYETNVSRLLSSNVITHRSRPFHNLSKFH